MPTASGESGELTPSVLTILGPKDSSWRLSLIRETLLMILLSMEWNWSAMMPRMSTRVVPHPWLETLAPGSLLNIVDQDPGWLVSGSDPKIHLPVWMRLLVTTLMPLVIMARLSMAMDCTGGSGLTGSTVLQTQPFVASKLEVMWLYLEKPSKERKFLAKGGSKVQVLG